MHEILALVVTTTTMRGNMPLEANVEEEEENSLGDVYQPKVATLTVVLVQVVVCN